MACACVRAAAPDPASRGWRQPARGLPGYHSDTYPDPIVAGLRELGVFGLTIGPEYGGLGESLLTYALVAEEIARGWMSISGIINTHFIVAYLISRHGTAEQKTTFLPQMATGEIRAACS